ncbi:hypothetical protein DE4585_03354 [Mycobacteroides salmoniphilum]|uniref:Haemophore haem-binding domain-containing protein n=2 Tax=Mycobacteroides salmoniphilum TaxID=404941 RepID=A0A4R8RYH7_9MYCO|nr:hypothetical protein DE4585_03354 [Mycobacteroides salmoniphilum]TDZ81691.1 hypothetical protein DE4586_01650 [Mycobacteroides salmoniphilum]TDZ89191.1 hypothetical protein DE4587_01566 [Mycobacteroides salmoniphilum]
MLLFYSAKARRAVCIILTNLSIAAAAVLTGFIPISSAEPDVDPVINCDASGYQRVAAGVALATADYMDEHPDVRDAYTRMKSDNVKPSDEVEAYLAQRPDVSAAMSQLRQPLKDLMIRCRWGVPAS